MSEPASPTAEGRRRYPSTDGYNQAVVPPVPCVCTPSCAWPCLGECGCSCCSVTYAIWADDAGFSGPEPLSKEEIEEAESAYRALWGTRSDAPNRSK